MPLGEDEEAVIKLNGEESKVSLREYEGAGIKAEWMRIKSFKASFKERET